MASRGAFWGGIAGSLLVGGVLGFVSGWYSGFETTTAHYGNEWLYEQANDVETRVAVLRALRTGHDEVAGERLEAALDNDLISIRPDQRIGRRTLDEINKAIAEAKEYRTDFPHFSKRPKIDRMVHEIFAGAPYKSRSKQ